MIDPSTVRAARIVDTLHCHDLWVTDAVLADLAARGDVEVVERGVRAAHLRRPLAPFA